MRAVVRSGRAQRALPLRVALAWLLPSLLLAACAGCTLRRLRGYGPPPCAPTWRIAAALRTFSAAFALSAIALQSRVEARCPDAVRGCPRVAAETALSRRCTSRRYCKLRCHHRSTPGLHKKPRCADRAPLRDCRVRWALPSPKKAASRDRPLR
ncbi:hypothetical protein Dimus_036789, partial [Dionaea muscipula]